MLIALKVPFLYDAVVDISFLAKHANVTFFTNEILIALKVPFLYKQEMLLLTSNF